MIGEDEVERCLKYLATSAQEFAEAEGRRTWAAEALKIERARQTLASSATTLGLREAEALTSEAYGVAAKAYSEAESDYLRIRAFREAAIAKLDIWRSQNATARSTNV